MYRYEFYLKDGTHKVFLADSSIKPKAVQNFISEHKDDREYSFTNYMPVTVSEYLKNIKTDVFICK